MFATVQKQKTRCVIFNNTCIKESIVKQLTPSQISASRRPTIAEIDNQEAEKFSRGRGQDLKRVRRLSVKAGHSPHEAGTDQRVEDAKKARR